MPHRKTWHGSWLAVVAIPLAAVVVAGSVWAVRIARQGNSDSSLVKVQGTWQDKSPDEWGELLSHRNPLVRQRAVDALVQYGQQGVATLTQVVRRADSTTSVTLAADALGQIGPDAQAALPALREALDRHPASQDALLRALGQIGDPSGEALPKVLQVLADTTDELARVAAVECVGRLAARRPQSAEVVVAALAARLTDDPDTMVRVASADALGRLGPVASKALPVLDDAARSENHTLAQAARSAATQVRGQAFP